MEYFATILFALIQALTEFVPISSSGHLVLLHALFPGVVADELAFDVVLHAGTLLATVLYFRSDLGHIARASVRYLRADARLAPPDNNRAQLGWLLVLSAVPAAVAGYFLEDSIETTLRSPWVVVGMLALVGIAMVVIERVGGGGKDEYAVTWRAALGIGCAQALALIPGTSRSGSTIIAAMGVGLKREAAVRFSFLMSIPIIFGATLKQVVTMDPVAFNGALVVGFVVAVVVGYVVIHYLVRYVRHHSLAVFAYYRFALAALVAAWLVAGA